MVVGSDPEAIGQFTNSFVTERSPIWDKMVAIFQGTDAWTYPKPAKIHHDRSMGYNLIYDQYLGPSKIYNMASGDRRIFLSTHTLGRRETGPQRNMLSCIRI